MPDTSLSSVIVEMKVYTIHNTDRDLGSNLYSRTIYLDSFPYVKKKVEKLDMFRKEISP